MSGYAIRSRNLISAQHSSGEAIEVVTGPLHEMDDSSATEIVLDGVQYMRTPVKKSFALAAMRQRWPLLREQQVVRTLRRRLLEITDNDAVDIVYAHSPALCGLAALQAARKRGLPFIYEIRAFWEDAANQNRGGHRPLKERMTYELETYVAQKADAVAAIAKPMLQDLKSRGISANKLFHVPNGVDTKRLQPQTRDEALVRELGLLDRPVFGFFGSLYEYEGISWLIRAAAELRLRGHKFSTLIIGRGEDQPEIQSAIRDTGAFEHTRMIDFVPHEQIAKYYSVIDIAVYPRKRLRLTDLVTPLKPLEAMAFGKPVLASSVGGIRELVDDERTGLLFEPGNVSDFCRQAERMITSSTLCQSLSARGRAFVEKERDWTILAKRYREIYEFVLATPRARPC
jgi:PEP-CTERM/exosortase A-associated glycosyltransferase